MLNLSQHERDFMFMKLYLETKVVDKVNLDKLFEIFDDGTSRALSPNKRKTLILLKTDSSRNEERRISSLINQKSDQTQDKISE